MPAHCDVSCRREPMAPRRTSWTVTARVPRDKRSIRTILGLRARAAVSWEREGERLPGQTIHLEIGLRLVSELGPNAQPTKLLLGAIAPDAIHMRAGWTSRKKRYVHLARMRHEAVRVRLARLDDLWKRERDGTQYGFAWGWISHALADHLWWHLIGAWYWSTFRGTAPDEAVREQWYADSAATEGELARRMQKREDALQLLRAASPRGMRGYVTEDEVGRWRDTVLRWQESDSHRTSQTPKHFTQPRVDEFMRIVTETMREASQTGFRSASARFETLYPEGHVAHNF